MRLSLFVTWVVIASGCSSYAVRCDSHLRPINGAPTKHPEVGVSGAATHTAPRHNP